MATGESGGAKFWLACLILIAAAYLGSGGSIERIPATITGAIDSALGRPSGDITGGVPSSVGGVGKGLSGGYSGAGGAFGR